MKEESTGMPTEPALSLVASLLYPSLPQIDPGDLDTRVKCRLPRSRRMDEAGLHYVHEGYTVTLQDGTMPAQTVIFPVEEIRNHARWEEALPHARTLQGAAEILPRAKAEIIVSELFARFLPYKQRLHLFQSVLISVLETATPIGLLFHASQKIVSPQEYLRSQNPETDYQPLYGVVNVRLFRITGGTPGDVVMDSVGLYEFGLPDVQMHFRGFECGRIAGLLYSLAEYLFDNGDVIEDGHTVQGLTADDRWRCRHEMSLVGPERVVLDVDPGGAFAAGGRHT